MLWESIFSTVINIRHRFCVRISIFIYMLYEFHISSRDFAETKKEEKKFNFPKCKLNFKLKKYLLKNFFIRIAIRD